MGKLLHPLAPNKWKDLANTLTSTFSLPEINHNLAIYFKTGHHSLQVGFINNKCYIRAKIDESNISSPNIWIENKNIKFLLKILSQMGLNTATINEIIQLDFSVDEKFVCSIQLDTLLGDLLVINEDFLSSISKLLNISSEKFIKSAEIDNLVDKTKVNREKIFNSLQYPNPKIQNYTDKFAIDLLSGITTLSHKITAKSNDYSIYESYFNMLTGSHLTADGTHKSKDIFVKPISIVIPSFNSEATIVKTLFSIESQDISKLSKKELDVIVIDDGSDVRVFDVIKPYLDQFSFTPRIIRLEQNQGLSVARNMGIELSIYKQLLFIDSDILLAKNFIQEHSIRLQLIPNALFISFKQNIDPTNSIAELDSIKNGLQVSKALDDKRIVRQVENDTRWINKTVDEGTEELLGETDLFKKFGYGRTINGCFDLPSMVVGHNMSTRKDIVKAANSFSNNFSGWGLEDTYFGAKVISNGNFIIPVLSTNVYHINHPSRSGSQAKQLEQHKRNTNIYNNLIHQKI